MSEVPEYRLRLFMAVDLVNSTAFKASSEDQYDERRATPEWVAVFRDFYGDFLDKVQQSFTHRYTPGEYNAEISHAPKLWKIVGDELILCCRVVTVEHVATCIESFVESLEGYSKSLQAQGRALDVKGNAWIAAFPTPNVSIPLEPKSTEEGLDTSEDIEAEVDQAPRNFDFLGKAIDTGFRVAKHSRSDSCSVSVQLAYILARARELRLFARDVEFQGREQLKGVNSGLPYPILGIDTENRPNQMLLRDSERALTGWSATQAQQLKGFLENFITTARIDTPFISFRSGLSLCEGPPKSYTDFRTMYEQARLAAKRADEGFAEAETVEDAEDRGDDLPELPAYFAAPDGQ